MTAELLAAALDAVGAAVVVAGRDGRLAHVNAAARARLAPELLDGLAAAADLDAAGLRHRLAGVADATITALADQAGAVAVIAPARTRDDELHRANVFLDSIVENIPDMIFVKDAAELRFARINRAGEVMFGVPREALLGKNDFDFFPASQAAFFQGKDRETLRLGAMVDIEEEPIDTPRGQRWLHTKKIPIVDAEGTPRYLLGISEDITEQKHAREALLRIHDELERRVVERTDALQRTEEHLRRAQKLEAVGRLAGGIAHDFNNLLTVIMTQASALPGYLGDDTRLRRASEGIVDASRRAANLTRQLLAFSRQQVLQPRPLDLGAVLAGLAPTLGRMIGEHVDLVVTPPAGSTWIDADPGQIEQVVLNLVVNARDAMPDGGQVRLSVAREEAAGADAPRACVVLRVEDTGMGMDVETQARIFEPFFTTKAAGRGTGLGLATVYGIVTQSGGTIGVHTAPGRGARFEVTFPARPPCPEEARRVAIAARDGGETLLLVEDDPAVRAAIEHVLRGAGYVVFEAEDAVAALAALDRHGDKIDAMITDVVMAGMDGPALAAAARRRHAALRVLLISGYAPGALDSAASPRDAFLAKPFEPTTLLRRVRELLDDADGTSRRREG